MSVSVGIAAALILISTSVEEAGARPQIGPTSSASIGIRISVAPKYGVMLSGAETQKERAATPDRICMATNGEPTYLPVLLIRPAERNGVDKVGQETGKPLSWCNAGQHELGLDPAVGLLLIRPE